MMPEDYRKSLLKTIPGEKEKNMEIPRNPSPATPPATPEERISALERKIKEIDALVKGLTEELLDLKSIAMRLNKVSEERGRADLKMTRPAAPAGSSTVVVSKRPITPQAARTPEPEPAPEEMSMIMQQDGTLKPEKRKTGDYIVASASYSKKGKPQVSGAGKKSELIVAEEKEQDESKK
jgi:hypothetical protein